MMDMIWFLLWVFVIDLAIFMTYMFILLGKVVWENL